LNSGTQQGRQDLPDALCTCDGGPILTRNNKLYFMKCPYILTTQAPAEAQQLLSCGLAYGRYKSSYPYTHAHPQSPPHSQPTLAPSKQLAASLPSPR
jgi:hypothetical protein